tara:strand:- start:620 stop:775 length:156 start_codon:yes stop_codon:yes gene_type:complete
MIEYIKDKSYQKEWEQLVSDSKEAIEDFNDFQEDRVIVWAANLIAELNKGV